MRAVGLLRLHSVLIHHSSCMFMHFPIWKLNTWHSDIVIHVWVQYQLCDTSAAIKVLGGLKSACLKRYRGQISWCWEDGFLFSWGWFINVYHNIGLGQALGDHRIDQPKWPFWTDLSPVQHTKTVLSNLAVESCGKGDLPWPIASALLQVDLPGYL